MDFVEFDSSIMMLDFIAFGVVLFLGVCLIVAALLMYGCDRLNKAFWLQSTKA